MRVSEDTVRHWLAWARNYGEIVSFESVAPRGRRWRIVLPIDVLDHYPESFLTERAPQEIVLTSREAMAFALGCAAGGQFSRPQWTQEDWQRRAAHSEGVGS